MGEDEVIFYVEEVFCVFLSKNFVIFVVIVVFENIVFFVMIYFNYVILSLVCLYCK